jgi:hypothetical protein
MEAEKKVYMKSKQKQKDTKVVGAAGDPKTFNAANQKNYRIG